jgi:hypothetical protein
MLELILVQGLENGAIKEVSYGKVSNETLEKLYSVEDREYREDREDREAFKKVWDEIKYELNIPFDEAMLLTVNKDTKEVKERVVVDEDYFDVFPDSFKSEIRFEKVEDEFITDITQEDADAFKEVEALVYSEAVLKAKPAFDEYWKGIYTKYGITDPEEAYYLDPNNLKMYKEVEPTRLQYEA